MSKLFVIVMINGWINVNKDAGITSNDVLYKLKKILNVRKMGYIGTLDPFATGVLPIAIGKATKLIYHLENHPKVYTCTIKWGEETETLDTEGKVIHQSNHLPTSNNINAVLPLFLGMISQIPPKFSAIRINGQRAYQLARNNIDFSLSSRNVHIYDISLVNHDISTSELLIHCSKGTYIRSLIRDIAYKLGTYAYALKLTRIQSSNFHIEKSYNLNQETSSQELLQQIKPIITPFLNELPSIELNYSQYIKIQNGNDIKLVKDYSLQPHHLCYTCYRSVLCAVGTSHDSIFRCSRVFV